MATHARFAIALAFFCGLMALAGCAAGYASPRPQSRSSPSAPRVGRAASFISLWPACACGKRTLLEQFSLTNGRLLRGLTTVPSPAGGEVANPHTDSSGRVWITTSTGPQCTSNVAGCGPQPNSCSGRAARFDPTTGSTTTELTFPSSILISDTLPSPTGGLVAMTAGGCATSFFNEHIVVRELASGRQWTIGADAAPCHALGDPAWSPDGSKLVFPYGPSVLSRHAHPPGGTCQAPRPSGLVVVRAGRSSRATSWKPIKPDRGCSYQAATFDHWGIAAIEGCHGLGNAYLIQLNPRHRVRLRLALARGYDGGDIVNDPRTGTVLVSEYQAANQGTPVFNWVWEFNGHSLRTIRRYPNNDAPTVIAEPW